MPGSGDRWLLLHGTPLSPAVWHDVAACLRKSGQVWCPDVTPPATSGGPEAQAAPDAQAARDAQAAQAARLAGEVPGDAGRLHVVGHSFGGQVALDLALLAPQRVATLTVLCSRDTPYPPFAAVAAGLRRGDPVDVDGALGRWFTGPELDADGTVVGYARRCLREAGRGSWATALDAIAGYDRAGRTGSVTVPATLVAAGLDQVSTPAAMADFAGRLPRANLHVLPGAAHMSPFTDPAALARLIGRAARAS